MWGYVIVVVGFGIVIFVLIFGFVVDEIGWCKVWIVVLLVLFVICCWVFWYVVLGNLNGIWIVLIVFVIGMLLIEIVMVFSNVMMMDLVL